MKRTLLLVLAALVVAGGVYWTRMPAPVEVTTPLADDMLVLEEPLPDSVVSSPLKVRGKARGTWFFEAVFPVTLTNWDGLVIAESQAHAQGEWMTEGWVPFEAVLEFTPDVSVSSRATLILKKDNPSGLPEHDDSREVTLFFAE